MNRAEAAAILSVGPDASPEEARRAYQDLFTEHQVRLTNAPTPALRSLYQARLLELDEARDVLLAPSLGDADSDLPTDQPSIPGHIARDTAPSQPASPPASSAPPRQSAPPPEQKRAAPPEPPRASADASAAAPKKKGGGLKKVGAMIVFFAVVGFAALKVFSGGGSGGGGNGSDSTASPSANYADSLPPIRESITVARVEFGRGDYDAANKALGEADQHYSSLAAIAGSDTTVTNLKAQLDSLHGKVVRACAALKKVAERHPGEPTCKTL